MYRKIMSLFVVGLLITFQLRGQPETHQIPGLQNPMTVEYLKKNLRKKSPRLILTSDYRKDLREKVKSIPPVENYYAAIKLNAAKILDEPLLQRIQIGRRLLSVSREMLYRMGILSMVYSIENDEKFLRRINDELTAVCNFTDWNPSHYLDVAEMALAVALAIDWVGSDLPKSTVEICIDNLVKKGIEPSYNEKGNVGWINGSNNWNQVCHGGMIAAAIVVSGDYPELASRTLHRALEGIPHAMAEYGPDGVYPEGSTYWDYGTSFSVLTSSMLKTAFGTDFGLAEYPAFLESADFRKLCTAPSGWYYNFADCGDRREEEADIVLAWFATHTGNAAYYEKERFLQPAESMGKLSRIAGPGLVWLSQFESKTNSTIPLAWKGEGSNPIVIFRGGETDSRNYYFGGKGGWGQVNHGNMDAGSFIFELDGVRWSIDPGNQSYHELEKTGFNLWGKCQDCERWTLLTKNNFGHSTLSVNNSLHVVDGLAPILDFKDGMKPQASIDLSPAFGGKLKRAKRTFTKDSPTSLLIEDLIEIDLDSTQLITWHMMTTADVQITRGGALLTQNGKQLKLENLSHPEIEISIISLDPSPLELDRKIEGLKRIELRFPAYVFEPGQNKISIRLAGL
ncbi:MAG: heparinase II/III family protein [Saprospiraceae bacterium]|nr:heparinase II/III family protein [Saprospiraceae bacterium]